MIRKFINKTAILITVAGLSTSVAWAQPYAYEYPPQPAPQITAEQKPTPDMLLKNGIKRVVDFLRNSGARDLGQILNFIDEEISGYFDFKHMTTLAAGRHARNMTQEELETLSGKIRATFIESLSKNLVDYAYTNKNIRFFKPRRSRYGNEVTVTAMITHPRGYPTKIAFRFHPTSLGWKVYDLSANGQSAVLHYRETISRMQTRNMERSYDKPERTSRHKRRNQRQRR